MVEIKEMPYDEKYSSMLSYLKLLNDNVLSFVEKELGAQKVAELGTIWQNGIQTIPEDATYEEKYNIGYGNWVRKYVSAFNFVSDNLGENGVEKFKDMSVEAFKRKSSSPALFLLRLMRAVSPQTAFRTFAKQMSYQWQVFTPLSVSELSGNRLVAHASPCKIFDYSDSEVCCTVSCQYVSARWLEDQFKHKMTTNLQGKNCTITIDRK
ncbi:MAG: hypothetical protein ABSD73_10875 [Candidatus Bathyarchaeia archaeon]|jgi:hypothetical protein